MNRQNAAPSRKSAFSTLFSRVPTVCYPKGGAPVARTAAGALSRFLDADPPQAREEEPSQAVVRVGLAGATWAFPEAIEACRERASGEHASRSAPWMWAQFAPDGSGAVTASVPSLLYALARLLPDRLAGLGPETLREGLFLRAPFYWNRAHNDYALSQTARTARGFEPEVYVRHLAAVGYTHVEVNSLASPVPHEPGVPDEFYSPFYTYCPGLNQFVESPLTRGVYPAAYLSANLNRLKRLADLCRRYGLQPGLLCFEPRTLPESFFQRYPTLRGARVDHPFRSRMPRYTLAQDHPATRTHYRRLMERLMEEVPSLAYLSVWSNDSGAGFEHTSSLYVGRNGGPYLIREWRSHKDIAEAAGQSVLRFLRLLRDAAEAVNPDFEVVLRIEHFKAEHDTLMEGMGNGLTVEAPSLRVRGYDLPYDHPEYPQQDGVAGSLHHRSFNKDAERRVLQELRERGAEPHLYYAAGPAFNLEPLLGIPFPRLLHQKLQALRETGFERISALGGLLNTSATPYWPNPEVVRAVQLGLDRPLSEVLYRTAARWVGDERAGALVELWDTVDAAVARLPVVPLYTNFGFVWLRVWVRPLVPDIEAIPAAERRYYERFMVSTPNNPNINDLSQDVLFDLFSRHEARQRVEQFDAHVLPRLEAALSETRVATSQAPSSNRSVFADLQERVRALQCWATSLRNVCAWTAHVHGYLDAETDEARDRHHAAARDMVASELENARALLDLWENAESEFMLVSGTGETAFIHGENFGDLLKKKIRLMEAYGDSEPRIDTDIVWRL